MTLQRLEVKDRHSDAAEKELLAATEG